MEIAKANELTRNARDQVSAIIVELQKSTGLKFRGIEVSEIFEEIGTEVVEPDINIYLSLSCNT